MLPNEFREITKIQISNDCYYALIDGYYCNSDLDKFQWCRKWKRNGGVNDAMQWEISKRIEAEQKLAKLKIEFERLKKLYDVERENSRIKQSKLNDIKNILSW